MRWQRCRLQANNPDSTRPSTLRFGNGEGSVSVSLAIHFVRSTFPLSDSGYGEGSVSVSLAIRSTIPLSDSGYGEGTQGSVSVSLAIRSTIRAFHSQIRGMGSAIRSTPPLSDSGYGEGSVSVSLAIYPSTLRFGVWGGQCNTICTMSCN